MTKIIDIPEEPEPPLEDKPVVDAGDGAAKEPLSMAELEARTLEWTAKQKKFKPAPHVVYTRRMHKEADAKYYSGRPRSMGSETQRRSVNRVGRAVADHGAHSIRGAYGASKDTPKADPVPTYTPAPKAALGYCRECSKAIPRVGMRIDAKFCCEAHSKAFRRKEKVREEANKAFRDYHQSAQAKAEAVLSQEAYHAAAREMQDSAARVGLEGAAFFATPVGVMGRADEALPPARFKVTSNIDDPRYGALPVQNVIEVQTSPVPELGAVLYTFVTPPRQANEIGKQIGIEVYFEGDPDEDAWSSKPASRSVTDIQMRHGASYSRWLPGTNRSAQLQAEERMRNLLARPDHDVIIAEFEEAKDWFGLREFFKARNRQRHQNASVRDNPNNTQSKQRVS
jgi:hypothetical protein